MNRKMRELIILAVFILFIVLAAPHTDSGHETDQKIDESGHADSDTVNVQGPSKAPEQPAEKAGQAAEGKKPSLPKQASDTAKNVVDTVFGAIGGAAGSVGEALQNLLGGGKK